MSWELFDIAKYVHVEPHTANETVSGSKLETQ